MLNSTFIIAAKRAPAKGPALVTSGSTSVASKTSIIPACGKKSCIAVALVKVTVYPENDAFPKTNGLTTHWSLIQAGSV